MGLKGAQNHTGIINLIPLTKYLSKTYIVFQDLFILIIFVLGSCIHAFIHSQMRAKLQLKFHLTFNLRKYQCWARNHTRVFTPEDAQQKRKQARPVTRIELRMQNYHHNRRERTLAPIMTKLSLLVNGVTDGRMSGGQNGAPLQPNLEAKFSLIWWKPSITTCLPISLQTLSFLH